MKQSDLQSILVEFAAERLALLQRHEFGARVVSHYDFNNTYQYVINREETHLTWIQSALTEHSASVPVPPPPSQPLEVPKAAKKGDPSPFKSILDDDARLLEVFVERWRPRVADVTHARHRIMLDVILGESLEHARLFRQAAEGFEDVLGRRTGGVARQGSVLSGRWQE